MNQEGKRSLFLPGDARYYPPTWSYLSFLGKLLPLRVVLCFVGVGVSGRYGSVSSGLVSMLVLMLSCVLAGSSSVLAKAPPPACLCCYLGLWCWSGQRTEELWEQKPSTLRSSGSARGTAPSAGPEERPRHGSAVGEWRAQEERHLARGSVSGPPPQHIISIYTADLPLLSSPTKPVDVGKLLGPCKVELPIGAILIKKNTIISILKIAQPVREAQVK